MLTEALQAFDADAVLAEKRNREELTLEIPAEKIAAVCAHLKQACGYERMSTVTAVDRYPAEPRYEVVYHLHSVSKHERVRLKCRVGGEHPAIDSITGVWRAANWYEREVFDLFGIEFRGHPDLRRIMLPEGWEGHPLRKDYPVKGYK